MFGSRGSRGRFGFLRTLNYVAFMPLVSRAPMYGRLLLELVRDDRIPASQKAMLGIPLAYLALPVDLIPEFIPVIGAIDDVAVVILALDLFLEGVPRELLDEKLAKLEIDPKVLDRDLAQVRRFVPSPVRRAAMRLPGVFEGIAGIFRQSGLDRRFREMGDPEGERASRARPVNSQEFSA
ncbi:MAG TPA: YkvA family protein [Candidatus Limnocylindrales bacterium]|nr:YkvA family protein [Candidatus Limnocylindrales bacterium]